MVTINDWNDLDAVRNDLTADYTLANDLDKDTAGYTGIGDDWTPLGFTDNDREGNSFTGELNGQGFQISDLVIEENNSSAGGVAFITKVGDYGLVENLSVDGTVDSTIDDYNYGGLVAYNFDTVENCVSHIDVTISSGYRSGGLVGYNEGLVTNSYATGSVDGDNSVGGLVGNNRGTIYDSYATASVDGHYNVGGLVGFNDNSIQNSYAVGGVTAEDGPAGGLVGSSNGYADHSYWDTQTSGQSTSEGGTGLTTSEMQGDEALTNMNDEFGFDYSRDWDEVLTEDSDTSADGYPILLALDRQNQLEDQGIYLSLTAPSNLTITDDSVEDELTLNWDEPSDDGTGYYVYSAESSGSTTSDYTQVGDVTAPPYTDTGLEDGEQYYYRVSSHD